MSVIVAEGFEIAPVPAEKGECVSALFRESYPPPEGYAIGFGYPFPQYMEGAWIARSIETGRFAWLGAWQGEELKGCLGATWPTTRAQAPFVELTGLVVEPGSRRLGMGGALIRAMVAELKKEAGLVLAQVRAGSIGGWKATASAGLETIGFEPNGHCMLGDQEPMLMMALIASERLAGRTAACAAIPALQRLANICANRSDALRSLASMDEMNEHPRRDSFQLLKVCAQDSARVSEFENIEPGVVDLNRPRGEAPGTSRFIEEQFFGRAAGQIVCQAHLRIDVEDRKAHLASLQALDSASEALCISEVSKYVRREFDGSGPMALVADVRLECTATQWNFAAHGFIPTVFYPAIINSAGGWLDCAQFLWSDRADSSPHPAESFALDGRTQAVIDAVAMESRRQSGQIATPVNASGGAQIKTCPYPL